MLTSSVMTVFLLSAPGGSEWILIILAVLILFGGRKIPEFMRGLGKGMREFNDAKNSVKKEFEDGMNEEHRPSTPPPPPSVPVSNALPSSTTTPTNP